MKTIAWGILVAALACGSGCARPDWIEQTLVTVDVTGTWQGSVVHASGIALYELTLEQQGPKVKGRLRGPCDETDHYPILAQPSAVDRDRSRAP